MPPFPAFYLRACIVGLLCLTSTTVVAQQRQAMSAAEVTERLHRLNTVASVMYVAAHPDDENTRLLAWLAKGQHIRTVYLSLTRGDGGQNILGAEQGSALGLIRTHELLEARKMDGAEQLFARAIDFGFSKNATETFAHWNKAQLVVDVVRAIQDVRPDLVICRFPKDSMAGHGQHSASAIIAEEAVNYCYGTADDGLTREVDSILAASGVRRQQLWKPTRLLFNAFRFGDRSTIQDDMFKVTVGQFDPLLGMGYGELAGKSRSIHRSQGAGTPSNPGKADEFFRVLAGKPLASNAQSLFDGIDLTWSRIGLSDVADTIAAIIHDYRPEHPELVLPRLFALRNQLASVSTNTIRDGAWLDRKKAELNELLLGCMGLVCDISVPKQTALAGDQLAAQLRITQRSGRPVSITHIAWPTGEWKGAMQCNSDELVKQDLSVTIDPTTSPTNPYWLDSVPVADLYVLADNAHLRSATTFAAVPMRITAMHGNDSISFWVNLSSKRLDPTHGDVIEPLRIMPLVSIESMNKVVMATSNTAVFKVHLHAFAHIENATVTISQQHGECARITGVTIRSGMDTVIAIPATKLTSGVVQLACHVGQSTFRHTVREIRYDHLPTLQMLELAQAHVVAQPIICTAGKVGYVKGAGDAIPQALEAMGVAVEELADNQLLDAALLRSYDAIVVGVRAVNVRKSMSHLMPALLDYVHNGGTLVMQYTTTQDMSTKQLGPFPFTVSRNRVTEEDAAVTVLQPKARLLTYPNVITSADFTNWVQERGLYFPFPFDERYTALLSMADGNEQQQHGSLLYAQYGRGHYIYCALSLFRQVPVGVPGSMRLLANMISVGK